MGVTRGRPAPPPAPVRLRVPGDKSITQRALLLALCARGRSVIRGPLVSGDTRACVRAIRIVGARVRRRRDGALEVLSPGIRRLRLPGVRIPCGESATLLRLLLGVLSGVPGRALLTGAPSLRRRPMGRVVAHLCAMGADLRAGADGRAPVRLRGRTLRPVEALVDPPSAQVKSALLLASALHAPGSVVREPVATRDHTERLLAASPAPDRSRAAASPVAPLALRVPGDLSSALLLVAASLVIPGLRPLRIVGVGLNPTRTRALELLRDAGADLAWRIAGASLGAGEPAGEIVAGYSVPTLRPLRIGAADAARAIDEIPALLAVAAFARGTTVLSGAAQLRAKERDRIAACVALLAAFGLAPAERADGLSFTGGAPRAGAGDGTGDHRIAACAAILALATGGSARGVESLAKSYPSFLSHLAMLGGRFSLARDASGSLLLHS